MKTRGAISLVFDDGYKEIISDVFPLLKKYQIKATIAVPVDTGKVEHSMNTELAPLDEWKTVCQKEGHELAAHGINHVPLTSLSDNELELELKTCKEKTSASTLVYPGGAFNGKVIEHAKTLFTAARTTAWGIEKLKPQDHYSLKTVNATVSNFAVWKWNILALQALLENRWLIETYHRINNNTPDSHNVSLEDFESHLKFIKLLPLNIGTLENILKQHQ